MYLVLYGWPFSPRELSSHPDDPAYEAFKEFTNWIVDRLRLLVKRPSHLVDLRDSVGRTDGEAVLWTLIHFEYEGWYATDSLMEPAYNLVSTLTISICRRDT